VSLESVKGQADKLAELNAQVVNLRAQALNLHKGAALMMVPPNYKFFRRLSGLRGSDLVKIPELS
jgi:hypothetical protein